MDLLVEVTVGDLRTLLAIAGVNYTTLAEHMGLSENAVSLKLNGKRPMFVDEIDHIVKAINAQGRCAVTKDEVVHLFGGLSRLKVRGYAG